MYSFKSKVRYSEVDDKGLLTLGAILDYFQDCSSFQSDSLGIGMDYLMASKKGWILVYWDVHIDRYAKSGEDIEIFTWPYELKGCFGYRNFCIKDTEGKMIAYADSLWVYMDLETLRPLRAEQVIKEKFVTSPRIDMENKGRKVKTPDDLERREPFRVRKSDIDTNGHVNNSQYVKIAAEYIPGNMTAKSVRVEYRDATYLGQTFEAKTKMADNILYVVLENGKGQISAIIEMELE
ncbi:MAG: acyl-[acyl-carrier-protein] thioesterase [Eubacterium sp.]|nr:acyl-[acyl-carrier-protein] thioesterase [Eubacterium sp.]